LAWVNWLHWLAHPFRRAVKPIISEEKMTIHHLTNQITRRIFLPPANKQYSAFSIALMVLSFALLAIKLD
jgi:hypothetical protein